MPLHLLKLCVGCDSVRDLETWITEKRKAKGKDAARAPAHVTRMTPKRAAELLNGGSLYWVIRGEISCRQRLIDIGAVVGADGVRRCALALDPAVVRVEPRSCRPFQGWRYLEAADAPRDLDSSRRRDAEMPETLRRELRTLGLL